MKIEMNDRKSAMAKFEDGWHKEHDFMEVTLWSNNEGYDVQINDTTHFSIHFTELKMLKKLIKELEK